MLGGVPIINNTYFASFCEVYHSMRLCIPSVYLSPVIQCESATREFCWTVK